MVFTVKVTEDITRELRDAGVKVNQNLVTMREGDPREIRLYRLRFGGDARYSANGGSLMVTFTAGSKQHLITIAAGQWWSVVEEAGRD